MLNMALLHLFVLMDSLVDPNAQYEELILYFASYLREMSAVISQVKSLAYSLINIPQPAAKNPTINNDIASVMSACKKAFDDIKRTESIMRGHVKGKESPSSSRITGSNTKIQSITPIKCPELQIDFESNQLPNEAVVQSARTNIENSPKKI